MKMDNEGSGKRRFSEGPGENSGPPKFKRFNESRPSFHNNRSPFNKGGNRSFNKGNNNWNKSEGNSNNRQNQRGPRDFNRKSFEGSEGKSDFFQKSNFKQQQHNKSWQNNGKDSFKNNNANPSSKHKRFVEDKNGLENDNITFDINNEIEKTDRKSVSKGFEEKTPPKSIKPEVKDNEDDDDDDSDNQSEENDASSGNLNLDISNKLEELNKKFFGNANKKINDNGNDNEQNSSEPDELSSKPELARNENSKNKLIITTDSNATSDDDEEEVEEEEEEEETNKQDTVKKPLKGTTNMSQQAKHGNDLPAGIDDIKGPNWKDPVVKEKLLPRTIFVKNLPSDFKKSQLEKFFARYGKIVNVSIKKPRFHGQIIFESRDDAIKALEVNGMKYKNNYLLVQMQDKSETDNKKLIYLKKVPTSVVIDDLWPAFECYGPIKRISLFKKRNPKLPSNALIQYEYAESSSHVLLLEKIKIKNQDIKICQFVSDRKNKSLKHHKLQKRTQKFNKKLPKRS